MVGQLRVIAGDNNAVVGAGSIIGADHRRSRIGITYIKNVKALAVVTNVEILARDIKRRRRTGAGIGPQTRGRCRVADVDDVYLAVPLVGNVEIFSTDRQAVRPAGCNADR